MPFALVRVSFQAVEMLVSFESPELRFKKDTDANSIAADWSLVSIGQCSMPAGGVLDRDDRKIEVRLGQAATEDQIMSLNVRSD